MKRPSVEDDDDVEWEGGARSLMKSLEEEETASSSLENEKEEQGTFLFNISIVNTFSSQVLQLKAFDLLLIFEIGVRRIQTDVAPRSLDGI